jgi:peroxiredoxin family protein
VDRVITEETVLTNGVVLEVEEEVVLVKIEVKLVEEGVIVMIFQVMDSLNIIHKREEVLVEQTGIFKTHHSQVEIMVDMEEEVEAPIAVILQEVTRMRLLIEDKVVEVKVIVPAEGLEMEVLVLFK